MNINVQCCVNIVSTSLVQIPMGRIDGSYGMDSVLAEKMYKMCWDNAIAEMQHFFVDKDLNFAILNQEKFLHDMLSEGDQDDDQDESEVETPGVEET